MSMGAIIAPTLTVAALYVLALTFNLLWSRGLGPWELFGLAWVGYVAYLILQRATGHV